MDIATVIGLIGTIGCILFAIFIGGDFGMFINVPSILIVLGGTAAVTIVKYPLKHTLNAIKIALNAFFNKGESTTELIETSLELANIARREGVLGLEGKEIANRFLSKGVQLVVDGHPEDYVRRILNTEIGQTIERHDKGKHIFSGMAESAPAMGMIGTLIGLVQMMSNMSDPSSIGPAMAVALLTTLYGAVVANAVCGPIADKLGVRSDEERVHKELIIEAVRGIQAGESPQALYEMLVMYLPGNERKEQ
jgi:chemotaxis protein MotA